LKRRKLLKYSLLTGGGLVAAGTVGWHQVFDGPLHNPCLLDQFPESLNNHPLMQQAFSGIDFTQLWDPHFHLIGNGLSDGFDGAPTGAWITPNLTSWSHPTQRLQYHFYMDAACVDDALHADKIYVDNANKLARQIPAGSKFMLLAFDYLHDNQGRAHQQSSTFYIPNEYAARVAHSSHRFEWIASVHPYREDALDQLDWCKENGAKAIKWLPPAMNIDPSSNKCKNYYRKLVDLNMPLLSHAGEEKAVHSEELQQLANPLLLRTPLDAGVKVIVAHCASLGNSIDLENSQRPLIANFDLFARLMNDDNYKQNCLADISAINLINRDIKVIKQIVENTDWHERLLYASDYPLPGVMPLISTKNLVKHGLIQAEYESFLNLVRIYNPWLYDFLLKRLMGSGGSRGSDGLSFSNAVFHTKRHFS